MKNKIEHPKVFISYAWGREEYKEKVLMFATELLNDGIEVILDQWSLEEGNDLINFMEKTVTDPTITNVLILLDPEYKQKANTRLGGVGTETQIISTEVYNKVDQTKFLPIVFEREKDGTISKPQYLVSRFHFDLSEKKNYDNEYKRLVRTLYGRKTIKKPEVGQKPSWVDEDFSVPVRVKIEFEDLKKRETDNIQKDKFQIYLNSLKKEIIDFRSKEIIAESMNTEEYITLYDSTRIIRDKFLELIKYRNYVPEAFKKIAIFLEESHYEINKKFEKDRIILRTLLHEIFLYTIAIYLKNNDYDSLAYTLGKTYFETFYSNTVDKGFNLFYTHNTSLDEAMCKKNKKTYYSGTAEYWLNSINIDICNKNEFIFADILCYNASMIMENYKNERYWFPLTYIYGDELFKRFCIQLKSKEYLEVAAKIFGFNKVENFKNKLSQIENKIKQGEIKSIGYETSYEAAPVFYWYIKAEELGTRN